MSGTVKNVRGEGLAAVVVLYLPSDHVRFQISDENGKFSFTDVPTGTWTIGYLGQGDNDVVPVIPDAPGSNVSFSAKWYKDALLSVDGNDGPDPIAQGATLVTISAGSMLDASTCFGCGSVIVKPPVIGDDYILVDFADLGLVPTNNQNSSAEAALTYRVACDSDSGKSTSATQDSYPVRVSGFTPGAPYVCSAQVLSNGLEVSSSAAFEVTVGKATPATPAADPASNADSFPTSDPSNEASQPTGATSTGSSSPTASPAKLAYTGANIVALVIIGLFMVLMGLGVALTSMRLGSVQERRRATS